MTIAYSVTATIEDPATRNAYLQWLREGHVREVVQGGALRGEIIVHDNGARVTTAYLFADRDAFYRYEVESAPALRADGLRRFGPDSGCDVVFERAVGEVTDVFAP